MNRAYGQLRLYVFTFIISLFCNGAGAESVVVLGRLIGNEPMDYVENECPEDYVCLRSWWKSVIRVETVIQGRRISGKVSAAVMQHSSLNNKYKKSVRLFILKSIDNEQQRKKLHAEYYLEEMSEPYQMYCIGESPEKYNMNTEEVYRSQTPISNNYCFEIKKH